MVLGCGSGHTQPFIIKAACVRRWNDTADLTLEDRALIYQAAERNGGFARSGQRPILKVDTRKKWILEVEELTIRCRADYEDQMPRSVRLVRTQGDAHLFLARVTPAGVPLTYLTSTTKLGGTATAATYKTVDVGF